jgi:oxygen-independent coproporphyrinogen-3 oxidase
LRAGINRFSVGAQTFNDGLLTMCGRKHSAADTRATLKLLEGRNYSFDLLFALPGQTSENLQRDLDEVLRLSPPHLSAYCLTVPESHPMSKGRPPENEQIGMFEMIETSLASIGLNKYEISNFAKAGMESRHNSVYWRDENYWGIGLSSHSYRRDSGPNGMRFWNPKSLTEYARQVEHQGDDFEAVLPTDQYEKLATHEALTDFCHMFLRTMRGLPENALRQRFSPAIEALVQPHLLKLAESAWIQLEHGHWKLTREGQLISNKVFEELTFLAADLPSAGLTRSTGDTYCSL